jgi:hypothetical protein
MANAAGFPNLTVLDHPLIQYKLTLLRDRHTTSRDFKALVGELAGCGGSDGGGAVPQTTQEAGVVEMLEPTSCIAMDDGVACRESKHRFGQRCVHDVFAHGFRGSAVPWGAATRLSR